MYKKHFLEPTSRSFQQRGEKLHNYGIIILSCVSHDASGQESNRDIPCSTDSTDHVLGQRDIHF